MQQTDQSYYWTIGNNKPKRRKYITQMGFAVMILALCIGSKNALAQNSMPDYATLVEQQGQVVVKITARKHSTARSQSSQSPLDQLPDELRRYFEQLPSNPNTPRAPQSRPSTGFGSGFIISSDGYIVTNHHVIENAEDIEVSLQNRKSYAATLVGSDPRTDLAVLKVDEEGLPAAQLGDIDSLKVGQWVLAIGSPFGFDYTATQGIVSALSRSLPSNDSNYVPFIQTDVAVNPGNSGGPLFDLDGRVVGVNSQIYTRSGGYMGLSFAIPVDVVKYVVEQLRETGSVRRGWLGVAIQEVDRALAESFGMDRPRGALVAGVTADSPADAGGLEAGDVILTFDGKSVASSAKLPAIVGSTSINTAVDVVVLRAGEEKTLNVTIGVLNEVASNSMLNDSDKSSIAGFTLIPLDKETQEELGIVGGLIVESIEPQTAAAKSGVQSGDILLSLNRKPIETVEDFRETYETATEARPLPLLVARGTNRIYLPLMPENKE